MLFDRIQKVEDSGEANERVERREAGRGTELGGEPGERGGRERRGAGR